MQSKLTLRIDEQRIQRAKQQARARGTSVSALVAGYFAARQAGATHLVTRNPKDYRKASLEVCDPDSLLSSLAVTGGRRS